jgi:hypothetical protein
MKTRILQFLIPFCFIGCIAKSATIIWANTNGGDWNIATNWIPAQVPASGDDAVITNAGTYTVTNDTSVTPWSPSTRRHERNPDVKRRFAYLDQYKHG